LNRILPCLLAFLASASAQFAPRAEVVDPALAPAPANDFFLRGKNIYDTAQASTDFESRMGYYRRAAEIFAEYVRIYPTHENAEMAWWYLGNSHYQAGQIDEAKRCFNTLLNRYGQGKWAAAAAYTLAADHYNRSEYAFAAPMFERYAGNASKPEERARGNYFAGNCYRLLGRTKEAIRSFTRVVEDPAGSLFAAQAKIAIGHLSLKDGKLEEAYQIFRGVVDGPHAAKYRGEAALHAALTATKLGKTDDADQLLKLVLNTPGMEEFRPDAQTALMGNYFAKKEYREVIRIFTSSASKAKGEKEAMRLMIAGRAYMRLKQPSQALGLFREIEKLVKPENDLAFEASYYRLLCFFQIEGRHVPDQVDAFLQLYRRMHADDPKIHTALMMKAETLFAARDVAKAAKVYGEVNATAVSEKNRPGLYYQRGWCLSEAGDHQGALRSLTEFITRYPNDARVPSAMAKRATAYAGVAEPDKAIAEYDQLLAAKPPEDLVSFAWLESARLLRSEGRIEDMIVRYRGLLQNVKGLSDNLSAEANYWIGWGMVKTNKSEDSVPYLEKARELRKEAYGKHAGILLALGYFARQDPQNLAEEIQTAVREGYGVEIPEQALQWSGIQSFNAGDYKNAALSLSEVANEEDPEATPKEVWRYLSKAELKNGNGEEALKAAGHVLATEENQAWKADGLLDKAQALLLLDKPKEARVCADEALALRPQGRTSAMLRVLLGDLEMRDGAFRKAAAEYLIVVNFHEDKELKPLALTKLIYAFDQQGDASEAKKYRDQLEREFPGWQAPKSE
jgi:tetratricopeptide (TPR) repeat protein